MSYLLDTNVCIRYLNGQSLAIKTRLEETTPATVSLCSVVRAELLFGVAKSRASERTRAQLERQGSPIGPNDLMIAAIALAHDAILVTANASEFARVEGLQREDWEAPGV